MPDGRIQTPLFDSYKTVLYSNLQQENRLIAHGLDVPPGGLPYCACSLTGSGNISVGTDFKYTSRWGNGISIECSRNARKIAKFRSLMSTFGVCTWRIVHTVSSKLRELSPKPTNRTEGGGSRRTSAWEAPTFSRIWRTSSGSLP